MNFLPVVHGNFCIRKMLVKTHTICFCCRNFQSLIMSDNRQRAVQILTFTLYTVYSSCQMCTKWVPLLLIQDYFLLPFITWSLLLCYHSFRWIEIERIFYALHEVQHSYLYMNYFASNKRTIHNPSYIIYYIKWVNKEEILECIKTTGWMFCF